MNDLYLHSRKLESVFELLGSQENDITCSTGWVLARCPSFLRAFLRRIFRKVSTTADFQITLQHHHKSKGITDVEIFSPEIHIIIEAKRGWNLPSREQLSKYASRLRTSKSRFKALVVITECSRAYAELHLPPTIKHLRVHYFSWKEVHDLSKIKTGTHSERRLLEELQTYLRRIVEMQNQESNMVYVVVLARRTPRWLGISYIDVVQKRHLYFHGFGKKGWPKEPPNYIGFRYNGKLQSIHHVESSKIVDEMNSHIREAEPGKWGKTRLYTLGPAIKLSKEVRTGKGVWPSGHLEVALDLLLTSNTIKQAWRETKKRLSQME